MQHRTATRQQWLDERKSLLAREKEFNQARDALSAARRELPWVKIEKDYEFDTPSGVQTLSQLFGPHSQLITYHFMYGTDWSDPCKSCSFWTDNFNGVGPHLAARDAALVVISKAPLPTLQSFGDRMGWQLPWVSSQGSDFNEDYDVTFSEAARQGDVTYNFRRTKMSISDMPGISVFAKDDDCQVYHTYSTYSRGLDMLNGAYHLLDITPKGRDEADLAYSMAWLNYRDSYA